MIWSDQTLFNEFYYFCHHSLPLAEYQNGRDNPRKNKTYEFLLWLGDLSF